MSAINANIMANQSAFNPQSFAGGGATPYSQGVADFSGPFGVGHALVRGVGTVQIGPAGVSTSVPWAPGFSATAANTQNNLGLASPFATSNSYLNQLNSTSFGQTNPYTPLVGSPWDIPDSLMALGTFGGLQNSMSPYAGSGLPQTILPDGSTAFGGPGGGSSDGMINPYAPNGGYGAPSGGYGAPMGGGYGPPMGYPVDPGYGAPSGGYGAPMGGGYGPPMGYPVDPGYGAPSGGYGAPSGGYGPPMGYPVDPGYGAPSGGYGAPMGGGYGAPNPSGGGGFPDMFADPGLFAPVPQNVISGIAQSITHQGGDFANRYNLISDGVARLFLQGQGDPSTPRSQWASGSSLRSPFGIFESGVGWSGGTANAGLLGAQATGMAWAMVRNPANPAMITSYANPAYNNYNFNQGFTNA